MKKDWINKKHEWIIKHTWQVIDCQWAFMHPMSAFFKHTWKTNKKKVHSFQRIMSNVFASVKKCWYSGFWNSIENRVPGVLSYLVHHWQAIYKSQHLDRNMSWSIPVAIIYTLPLSKYNMFWHFLGSLAIPTYYTCFCGPSQSVACTRVPLFVATKKCKTLNIGNCTGWSYPRGSRVWVSTG